MDYEHVSFHPSVVEDPSKGGFRVYYSLAGDRPRPRHVARHTADRAAKLAQRAFDACRRTKQALEYAKLLVKLAASAVTDEEVLKVTNDIAAIEGGKAIIDLDVATFGEVARAWFDGSLAKTHPSAMAEFMAPVVDDYAGIFEKWFVAARVEDNGRMRSVADVPLNRFSARCLMAVLNAMVKAGRSPSTRRKAITLANQVLAVARAADLFRAPKTIFDDIDWPQDTAKKDRKEFQWMSGSDLERVAATTSIPLVDRLFWNVAAREGGRMTMLMLIQWEDCRFEEGELVIPGSKTKQGNLLNFPMQPGTLAALLEFKARFRPDAGPKDYVFTSDDGVPLATGLRTESQRFRGGAGEKNESRVRELRRHLKLALDPERSKTLIEGGDRTRPIRCHDIRAMFVTTAGAIGHSEAYIAARTDHQSHDMIELYKRSAKNYAEKQAQGRRYVYLNFAIPELRPETEEEARLLIEEMDARRASSIEEAPREILLLGSTAVAVPIGVSDEGGAKGLGSTLRRIQALRLQKSVGNQAAE